MNCISIDDEPMAIEVLERYIEKIPELNLLQTFREPIAALSFINSQPVDFILLDINMPGLSGMQFLHTLENKPLIIFTTAYAEYATESYEINAVDYLLKPISFERFVKAVNKLFNRNTEKESPASVDETYINLKSGPQLYRVKLAEIIFLEKDGNYFNVHTTKRKIIIRENMNDIFNLLPEGLFIRVHKSFIVALDKIDMLDNQQAVIGEHKIPIGKLYKERLLKIINRK